MSKYLIELELEQSFDDWMEEMRWKRNHDFIAFNAALSECQQLAREEVSAERERCAKICDAESEMYLQQNLDAMRKGIITHEHVEHSQICTELAGKIRGEK